MTSTAPAPADPLDARTGDLVDDRYRLDLSVTAADGSVGWQAHDVRLDRTVVIGLTYWPAGAVSPLPQVLARQLAASARVYDAGDHRRGDGWWTFVVTPR